MEVIIIGTLIYFILFLITASIVSKYVTSTDNGNLLNEKTYNEYRKLAWGLSFLAVFCMWLVWLCVYLHQMNPLISPILESEVIEILLEERKKSII